MPRLFSHRPIVGPPRFSASIAAMSITKITAPWNAAPPLDDPLRLTVFFGPRLARLAMGLVVLVAALSLSCGVAGADAAVEGPCSYAPSQAEPVPDGVFEARVWTGAALQGLAEDPTCQLLPLGSAKLAVIMRGRFRFDGPLDDLLARAGTISALSGLRYWSVTDRRWLALITEAHALVQLAPETPRADFTANELRSGDRLFYRQRDNRAAGPVVDSMKVRVTGTSAASIETENITTIRFLFMPLFPRGALQSRMDVQRLGVGTWQIRRIDWVGPDASDFALGHPASYVNRTAAMIRYFAGIQTDREPPAARD